MQITKGIVHKAQKVVIYGTEGIGKSTFASYFPDPLFIDTEESTNHMDVARLEKPSSWKMLLIELQWVKDNPTGCKTLVIDTIDWAEQLCIEHVCATYNNKGKEIKGIEDFGYGTGYVYVKEEFGRFLNSLQKVIDVGVNVVLTAHTQVRKFEQPHEIGSFDRYELKLGKKTSSHTAPLVKEWADMVLFANYKILSVQMDNKKTKAQGGKRVMFTSHHPNWDAKNRHNLPEELEFKYEEISHCIPNDPINGVLANQVKKPVVKKTKTAEPETPPKEDLSKLPQALQDLMVASNVTKAQIQEVVAQKGYYPRGTEIENYAEDFINGVLIGAWEQVHNFIKNNEETPF